MSIKQKSDRLRGANGGFAAVLVNQLGDGRNAEIFFAADLVAFANHTDIFDVDRFSSIDRRLIIMIGQNTAAIRIMAGVDRSPVHDRCARINGVMIAESHAALSELPKGRRILLAHKIGTHPVPNDDHNVSIVAYRSGGD